MGGKRVSEIQYLLASITEEQRQEFDLLVEATARQIETAQSPSDPGIRSQQNGCVGCAHLGLCLADSRDIGCMKIGAIASRGTKRDFVDLCVLAQEYSLKQLLGWFTKKFSQTNYSMTHILKSLSYFEEAEQDPMPNMLMSLSWEEVKQFFKREAPRLI